MTLNKLTRRGLLGRAVWLGTLGLFNTLRSSVSFAREHVAEGLNRIKGKIIHKSDPHYEAWRKSLIWYVYKPKRYPDTIIRAQSHTDVLEAVNYARDNGLKIAVRSTGHNPARATMREGGVLLDVAQLRDVEIDVEARTAWIGSGVRSAEFMQLCGRHDLAFPVAHTSMVGLGGYLLGGGMGWNLGEWDVACRSIIGAEVIMADGRKLEVSAENNADLLWAIRGVGPGFFGAAVRYKLRLYPLPKAKTKTTYIIPIERLPEVTAAISQIVAEKSKRLEVLAVLGRFHPPGTPRNQQGRINIVISAFAFGDTPKDVDAIAAPVIESSLPGLSIFKQEKVPMTFLQLFASMQTDHTSPYRTDVTNLWTKDPGAGLMTLAERLPDTASPKSFVLSVWGVNPDRNDADSSWTYFSDHYMSWYAIADEAAQIEANAAWMDESVKAMQSVMAGRYPNELDPLRYPNHIVECFSEPKWKRLGEMRGQFDPDGVFHSYLGYS